ncbi:CSC1-like protein At4g15430 [Durusdinium trenchii]|uniref:CSC1-like protein At4g15430 n=1 Tax=Durusdinium trenchii TaxID=1381693 RepID=A0ABP0HEX4_9DINO
MFFTIMALILNLWRYPQSWPSLRGHSVPGRSLQATSKAAELEGLEKAQVPGAPDVQDCEVASWAEMCGQDLPAGRCFYLKSNGSTPSCYCTGQQNQRSVSVSLEDALQTCLVCERHHYMQNGVCHKCPVFNAWSGSRSDMCRLVPQEKSELAKIVGAAAVGVLLVFMIFELLNAPLVVAEAKVNRATGTWDKMSLMISVQGPIVNLPKCFAHVVYRFVHYRVKGTGLPWLDFQPRYNTELIQVHRVSRRMLQVKDRDVPFYCATCKGSLHPTKTCGFFIILSGAIFAAMVGVFLPIAIHVSRRSRNGLAHTLVTIATCSLPIVLVVAILHCPVAWLLRRCYRRTPILEALEEYQKRIQHLYQPQDLGPDAHHPLNQGLQVLTLLDLWQHFESFIADSNSHFVCSSIVRPLTERKRASFVSLWGGRPVDYFVSASLGTAFSCFVRSIRHHAIFKQGPYSWERVSYWLDMFANNQWNIEAELSSSIMESAFARVLTGGIRGAVMVLDHEVQPLTRVWCLFEFLLAGRHNLDIDFATDVGVLGDESCRSFDVALEVSNKITSLRVADCQASSEQDKRSIFDFIVSELGSLEYMDEQIRALMVDVLKKNMAHMTQATGELMQRMDPGWGWGRGRTIQNALNEYKEQIHHQPHPGEDAAHPRNQGLLAHTLCEFWKHFQGFILGENMHSVVNTIVKPLTDARRSSFVCLWGGRKVDYFVSHSWGTSFRHFVQSIQSHALSKEGEDWKFASYWICSFANNQWNIEAELGASIMESAFARALKGGIKGVVMVLDHEVQPLTRVWCLFEFLLASNLKLELVFGTDVGVVGDEGCTSFDIALEVGKKIETLQVANCHASSEEDKKLGNVVNLHPWLYYLHALYCAYVCYTVKTLVYDAQEKFLARRFKWLKTLPHPRSRTVLVEGIPEEFVSEDKVREFFGLALGNDVVEEVHLLKKTKKLQQLVAYRDHSIDCKKQAEFQFEKTEKRPEHYKVNVGQVPEKVDSIEFYTDEVKKTEEAIADEYHRIQEESKKVGGVNCRNGFVTFKDRKSVELAKELDYHSDAYTWVLTEPPDLEMVRWDELRVSDDVTETAQELVGYACVFGLYAGFVPICLWITNLANSIHMGFLQPMWASLAPTMGLTLFLSFLPTVLLLVIDNCYKLRSSSRAQEMLLRWYFWFQVIFVLLVTAVGNDFWDFVKETMKRWNWIVVQWSTHFINLTRYINLSKYLGFSTVYTEEEAKKKAEPEDQDYYGFGARGARWCINLLVGIVFGTLNPAIPLLAAVNFVVCRAVYGYLIVAAETRKPDLGGNFWVMNMRHVLIGTMLYCILMTGVFLDRAPTVVPAARGPSVGLFNQRPSEGRIILNANDQTSKSCRLVLSRE